MKKVFVFCCTLFSLFAQSQELPAIDKSKRAEFFIPAKTIKAYNLTQAQADDWMKVYNNFGDSAAIQRVNDIRWQAASKEAAEKWFDGNQKMLSEDGTDITGKVPKPFGAGQWKVYEPSAKMKAMIKSMGVAQAQYDFTFTVDKYVAKIFVATTENVTVMDAWKFAWEGFVATLTAAGKAKKLSTKK